MPVLIRRGQLEDRNSVFKLAQLFNTGREPITRDEFAIVFERILQEHVNETSVLFVAFEDSSAHSSESEAPQVGTGSSQQPQRIIGYTLMSVSRLLHAAGLTGHLHEVVVDEEFRGQGVGESLIRANEAYCAQRGVRQISASTARFGNFFNHLGFEPVGEHYRKVLSHW